MDHTINTINLAPFTFYMVLLELAYISVWKVGKLMTAMFKILDESPARRDIYVRGNLATKFPQSFSETRWIEEN